MGVLMLRPLEIQTDGLVDSKVALFLIQTYTLTFKTFSSSLKEIFQSILKSKPVKRIWNRILTFLENDSLLYAGFVYVWD